VRCQNEAAFNANAMNARQAITLRPAIRAEAPELALMSRDLIEQGLSWRYTPPRMVRLLAERETSVVVACDTQGVQGFAALQLGDDSAHLVLLAVRAEQQRRGIGARLVAWHVATARAAGLARVGLELRADNDGARSFYARLGFECVQSLPAYYDGRLEALRMQLLLRETSQPGLG
jgi:ribosomal protein S18 acetylase RimI-like enzyme